MSSESIGRILIGIGLGIAVVGVVFYFFGGKPGALGRLPGDIAIEKGNFRIYFPITTLVLFNLLVWIGIRVWRFFDP